MPTVYCGRKQGHPEMHMHDACAEPSAAVLGQTQKKRRKYNPRKSQCMYVEREECERALKLTLFLKSA